MTNKLFSTYKQGENRVTSSIIAVLERLSIAALTNLFQMIFEDINYRTIEFTNQPKKGKDGTVPDARIKSLIDIIIETKIYPNQIVSQDQIGQIKGHLEKEDFKDSFLILLTPDNVFPGGLNQLAEPQKERLFWLNFESLIDKIDQLSNIPDLFLYEKEMFLLQELKDFFVEENLISEDASDKVLVIPARSAYPFYINHQEMSIYFCQSERTFQAANYMAFYSDQKIQKEIPKILAYCDNLDLNNFDPDKISYIEFEETKTGHQQKPKATKKDEKKSQKFILLQGVNKAEIEDRLNEIRKHINEEGSGVIKDTSNKVFILSKIEETKLTVELKKKITNDIKAKNNQKINAAFVQNQRYVSLKKLIEEAKKEEPRTSCLD